MNRKRRRSRTDSENEGEDPVDRTGPQQQEEQRVSDKADSNNVSNGVDLEDQELDDDDDDESNNEMAEWHGVTLKATYHEEHANRIIRCFAPFKARAWERALDASTFSDELASQFELRESPEAEPRGWNLLHYVAAGAGPVAIATRLVELGASRCAKDWQGRTPLEVAAPSASAELLAALKPAYRLQGTCEAQLDAMEVNFHKLILELSCGAAEENQLVLPPVRALLEERCLGHGMNFPVPGMYGGFYGIRVELSPDGAAVSHLICESWCRIVGGSGRRNKVTAEGTELLAEGFV